MDAESSELMDVKEKFGQEIRVFETISLSPSSGEVTDSGEIDEFYEFTAEDYYRMQSTKKEDKFLKTRKIREAEEAARRSKITKAIVRVLFPDGHTAVQSELDLSYRQRYQDVIIPEAYERLILDTRPGRFSRRFCIEVTEVNSSPLHTPLATEVLSRQMNSWKRWDMFKL